MNIIKLLLLTVVILSCSEQQIWQEIETGKTIKVLSQGFQVNNTNYIYKWSKPIGPEDAESNYTIEHDKMLFTPLVPGEYTIDLEIVNMMETKVYEETFYFNVINNNYTDIKKPLASDNLKSIKSKTAKKEKTIILNNRYTIQVASWTSLDKAKEDMNELIDLGFDTYIEEYFDNKNNVVRWRVRIGSFESKDLAQTVKDKLSQFRGEDPWIAFIK